MNLKEAHEVAESIRDSRSRKLSTMSQCAAVILDNRVAELEAEVEHLKRIDAEAAITIEDYRLRLEAEERRTAELEAEKNRIPQLSLQQLIDGGLNAFALQLFAESVGSKKDAVDFKPFSFICTGIKVTLAPAIPIPQKTEGVALEKNNKGEKS